MARSPQAAPKPAPAPQRGPAPAAPQPRRAAPAPAAAESELGPLVIQSRQRAMLVRLNGLVTKVEEGYILSVRRRQSQKTDDTLFTEEAVIGFALGEAGFILTDDEGATGAAFSVSLNDVQVDETGILTGTDGAGNAVTIDTNRMPILNSYRLAPA